MVKMKNIKRSIISILLITVVLASLFTGFRSTSTNAATNTPTPTKAPTVKKVPTPTKAPTKKAPTKKIPTKKTPTPTKTPTVKKTPTTVQGTGKDIVFEAEYVNLSGKMGAGPSNISYETTMVFAGKNASNGYFLGDLNKTNLFFDFVINSSKADTAKLSLALGSQIGALRLSPNNFEISVNGLPIKYTAFNVADSSDSVERTFKSFNIGTINLKEGKNTITLTVLENEYLNGGTGAPIIDCIKLNSDAKLTWSPVTSNTNGK